MQNRTSGAHTPPPRTGPPPVHVRSQATGKRSTVALNIQVLVEVPDDEYAEMVRQAIEDLQRRVVEAKTFLPMRMQVDRVYRDVNVQELKASLVIPPHAGWYK